MIPGPTPLDGAIGQDRDKVPRQAGGGLAPEHLRRQGLHPIVAGPRVLIRRCLTEHARMIGPDEPGNPG